MIILIFVFSFLTVACSTLPPTDLPPSIDIKNTKQKGMEDDMERQSSSYHHFLIGSMALLNQNFNSALDNLEKADELSGGKSATVHAKLSELYLREGLLEKSLEEIDKAINDAPNKIDYYYLKAGLDEALSKSDEAKKSYQFILEKDPTQKNAYLLLANIYRGEGDIENAKKLLEEMVEKFPEEVISYQYLAKIYEKEKATYKAENILKKAYEVDKKNDMLAMELCRVLILQSKLEEAKNVAMEVIKQQPNHALARRILAELSLQDENLDEALKHFNVLKDSDNSSIEIRYKIALIYMQKNMPKEAAKELNLLLASAPNHVGARYALGTVYIAQKKYEEAVEELKKIKFEDDGRNYVDAKLSLAFVLRQLGRNEDAKEELEEAYKNVPFDKKIATSLIMVYRNLEDYATAEDLILKFLEKKPGDLDITFNYAVLQYERGKKDIALEKMNYILEKNSDYSEALNYIAYSWAENGENLEKATEYVTRALKKDPKNPYYIDTLGWIKYKQKDYKEALDLLLQALNLTEDDIVIFEHIGDVYVAEDKKDLAIKYYEQALKKKNDELNKEELESIKRIENKLKDLK